jgi:adenine-specific DNA-methyltransferase
VVLKIGIFGAKHEQSKFEVADEKKGHVEEFRFDQKPIRGFPELHWTGKRPFTSTNYFPAQLKEVYGEATDGWLNKIYWDDNLQVISHLLKSYRGKISLIYIDPPYDSKADYKMKVNLKDQETENSHTNFEEKQYSDIWTNDEYLQFMYERLTLLRELLTETGSIYVHCDWHKGHHLKCVMDEVFGISSFQNEIAWGYKTQGATKKRWSRKHDTILFYTKSNIEWTFNTQYERSYMMHTYGFDKEDFKIDEEGRQYRDALVRDFWEISAIQSSTSENLPYPTQKPEALIQRILLASSNPGDIVFDCFMGSGTTQAVALKLGRRYIGADINLGAIQVTTKRLLGVAQELSTDNKQTKLFNKEEDKPNKFFIGFEVYNVNHYDVFRNPVEARELLLEALEINKLEKGQLFDGEKDGRMVKIMPVNRIASRADLGELIAGLDLKAFEKRHKKSPNEPVEKITLVCMGHEPDLKASLEKEVEPYKLDIEVVDILRDRQDLQFKRDSEAKVVINKGKLVIERFYPMNLLGKLSLEKGKVKDWRELVECVMIDWNYDGAVLTPTTVDIPEKDELVSGTYPIPKDAGTIRVKITDLLSESLEVEVMHG